MEIPERIQFFHQMISCNYNIPLWVYDGQGDACPQNEANIPEYHSLFMLSGCYNKMLLHSQSLNQQLSQTTEPVFCPPLILSDYLGLMWIAVYEQKHRAVEWIYVLGPVFISEASVHRLSQLIDGHEDLLRVKNDIMKQLRQIVVINATSFFQYASMLQYCASGDKISLSDFSIDAQQPALSDKKSGESIEGDSYIGAWMHEEALMKIIEDGDIRQKDAIAAKKGVHRGAMTFYSDPLFHAKAYAINLTAIASRAAIRGGLAPDTAYACRDGYFRNIEICQTITQVMQLNHSIYANFVTQVHKCKHAKTSSPIKTCCEYIDRHICDHLSIEDIASRVGYSEYYLTRKFKKEMNQSIIDYIKAKKIEYAKHMLSTTQQSVQDISDTLNFCSRSYFADTFQKHTGYSPRKYREEYLRL